MTTWTNLLRNYSIPGADDSYRNRETYWKLKEVLKASGWTVLGSGNASTYNWSGTDLWVSAPTGHYWWIAIKSPGAGGVSVLLQTYSNDAYVACSVLGYDGTGCNATTWPNRGTPPADELNWSTGSYLRNSYNPGYLNVFINDVNDSFICFTRSGGTSVNFVTAVIKLTELKTGDTKPYFLMRFGIAASVNAFGLDCLARGSYPGTVCKSPDGVQRVFLAAELGLSGDSVAFMNSLLADPNSGKRQLVECLACCFDTGKIQIKGKIPGVLRRPGTLAVGDTFNAGEYICVGDYAIPWDSLTAML